MSRCCRHTSGTSPWPFFAAALAFLYASSASDQPAFVGVACAMFGVAFAAWKRRS
jgi:hypothetical protein